MSTGNGGALLNGLYNKTAYVCQDKPVYQKGGSDGYVLYQPSGESYWMAGNSDHATDCNSGGLLDSSGNGGVCPDSPAGAGCAGKWYEVNDRHNWVPNPSFAVVAS